MEDAFHERHHGRNTLAQFQCDNEEIAQAIYTSLSGDDDLNEVVKAMDSNYTVSDVFTKKHPHLYVEATQDRVVDIHMNHRYIGAETFARFIDRIYDTTVPTKLPRTPSFFEVVTSFLVSFLQLLHVFLLIPRAPLPVSPPQQASYFKQYTISATKDRRMQAYRHFLDDASRVLGDTMQVSFTVGFQSNGEADDVVNNVGVLVLPYDATSMKTVKSLGSAFRAVAPMAAVTNFLARCRHRCVHWIIDAASFRRRIDLTITSFVVRTAKPSGIRCMIVPKAPVVESAYASLVSEIYSEGSMVVVTACVTTTVRDDDAWASLGFTKLVIKDTDDA